MTTRQAIADVTLSHGRGRWDELIAEAGAVFVADIQRHRRKRMDKSEAVATKIAVADDGDFAKCYLLFGDETTVTIPLSGSWTKATGRELLEAASSEAPRKRRLERVTDALTKTAIGASAIPTPGLILMSALVEAFSIGIVGLSGERSKVANEVQALKARLKAREFDATEAIERLIAEEGGTVTPEELANVFHVGVPTIANWRRKGRLFAIPKGERTFRFPMFQVAKGERLKGLEQVLAALEPKGLEPLAVADYFLNGYEGLEGRRPLDLLRKGDPDSIRDVVEHAERFMEQGG